MKGIRVDTGTIAALMRNSGKQGVPLAGPGAEAVAARGVDRAASAAPAAALESAFKGGLETARRIDALDAIDAHLKELESLVAERSAVSGEALGALQSRIDAVVGTINRAADTAVGRIAPDEQGTIEYAGGAGGSSGVDRLSSGSGSVLPSSAYRFSYIASGTEQVRANALLAPGQSLEAIVQVTTSAQQAGFFLSFGAASINLSAATARFVILVAGNHGRQQLSFASGTTVASMRDAINSFTDQTGVVARLSGLTGLTIKSVEYGDDQFVAVRAIDTGGINTGAAQAGVYELNATNNNAANTAGATLFSAASNLVRDYGQDIDGIVNGWNAKGNGRSLYAVTPNLQAQFRLSGEAAQSTLSNHAFTIMREAAARDGSLIVDPGVIGQGRASALGAIGAARARLAEVRDGLVQRLDEQRAAASALPGVSSAAANQALDPARVRELLLGRRG